MDSEFRLARTPSSQRAGDADSLGADAPWRSRALLLRVAVFLAITGALVAALMSWVGAADVLRLIAGVSPGHLAAATVVTLALPAAHAWRFRTVLGAIGFEIRWVRSYALIMATWPISSITPSKSGDLFKAYYLRPEVPATVTAGALLAERALDVAVLGAMSLAGSLLLEHRAITIFSSFVLGGIATFLVISPWAGRLPLRESWRERVRLLLTSTQALAQNPRFLLTTLGLTLVNWTMTIALAAILFDAVGARVPLPFVVAGLPPALFAGLMPFTLGGMGTRDSVIMLLFEGYATSAQSLSVGILFALFSRWLLSLIGIPFLQRLLRKR